jgi:hypothetical protein
MHGTDSPVAEVSSNITLTGPSELTLWCEAFLENRLLAFVEPEVSVLCYLVLSHLNSRYTTLCFFEIQFNNTRSDGSRNSFRNVVSLFLGCS